MLPKCPQFCSPFALAHVAAKSWCTDTIHCDKLPGETHRITVLVGHLLWTRFLPSHLIQQSCEESTVVIRWRLTSDKSETHLNHIHQVPQLRCGRAVMPKSMLWPFYHPASEPKVTYRENHTWKTTGDFSQTWWILFNFKKDLISITISSPVFPT